MTAPVYYLPPPKVRRALEELAIVGTLAIEGYRAGDHDLVRDCERWHWQRQAIINGARNPYIRRASA